MNSVLSYLAARFKEPSTWAGISTVMIALKVMPNDPNMINAFSTVGVMIGGVLAAAMSEGSSP